MATVSNGGLSKFRLARRGRKLQGLDPTAVLAVLPKDVPERTWADIQQREELDLFMFELREEIFDAAMAVGYGRYMERQTVHFSAQCAAKAWLQLFDWYFYRHDPGEEPTAYPPCYIPKRVESWTPDAMPEPSPKDPWCRAALPAGDVVDQRVTAERSTSSSSLVLPKVPEIPRAYWFPGKIKLQEAVTVGDEEPTGSYDYSDTSPPVAESEVLQRVTDYSNEELSQSYQEEMLSLEEMMRETNMESSMRGAGDSAPVPASSTLGMLAKRRGSRFRSHVYSRNTMRQSRQGQNASGVSDSQQTVVSDCRLRSLRLDTQYEISAEQVDSPPLMPRRQV